MELVQNGAGNAMTKIRTMTNMSHRAGTMTNQQLGMMTKSPSLTLIIVFLIQLRNVFTLGNFAMKKLTAKMEVMK